MEEDSETHNVRYVRHRPYDEMLDISDDEEVDSSDSDHRPRPPRSDHDEAPVGSRGNTPPDPKMSDDSDAGFDLMGQEDLPPGQSKRASEQLGKMYDSRNEDGEDSGSTDDEDEEDDDDDEAQNGEENLVGGYNPTDYDHLPVTPDIKELFSYITRYTPQTVELDTKMKPFIPDFIPAVGDIDAFLKAPRPDGKPDGLGLIVLDEPCAKQSDPTVLDLQFRAISKQTNLKQVSVNCIETAEKKPKEVENWIESISELHRTKPPPNVHYARNMPDIDPLMEEWPPEFEELLKEVGLPTADLDCDLGQYVDIVCSLLDIPIYKSKIQSLHVLFTLYSEFKNSQHFRSLASENKLDNEDHPGTGVENSDRLII